MSEDLGRFYVASIVLALEYMHENNLVFRDLKPENVLIDAQGCARALRDDGPATGLVGAGRAHAHCGRGVATCHTGGRRYAKLGDFGFAKYVEYGARTYTFCGTPGYGEQQCERAPRS